MIPPPCFRYVRPRTLDEALAAITLTQDARVLAGGTDFIMLRASGEMSPALVVDLKAIELLHGVSCVGDILSIGACVTLDRVASFKDPRVAALTDGAGIVGSPQTRNRATLGGNICRSSPAGDTLPALLALHASAFVASAEGERRVPINQFFLGPGQNILRAGEILTRVEIPLRQGASAYVPLTSRRWMDTAICGVAVHIAVEEGRCSSASVALGGVAPTPLLADEVAAVLVGSDLGSDAVVSAAGRAAAASRPIDDVRSTREYRLATLPAIIERAIDRASQRLAAGGILT